MKTASNCTGGHLYRFTIPYRQRSAGPAKPFVCPSLQMTGTARTDRKTEVAMQLYHHSICRVHRVQPRCRLAAVFGHLCHELLCLPILFVIGNQQIYIARLAMERIGIALSHSLPFQQQRVNPFLPQLPHEQRGKRIHPLVLLLYLRSGCYGIEIDGLRRAQSRGQLNHCLGHDTYHRLLTGQIHNAVPIHIILKELGIRCKIPKTATY